MDNKRKEPHEAKHNDSTKKLKTTPTIPIRRGRFKQKWLAKHSSLIKRSDSVSGIMVTCGVHSETRALGQVGTALDLNAELLFPDCETNWTRFEGDFDVDENVVGTEDTESEAKQEKETTNTTEHHDRKFQAVDAACGGMVFYRFRINVKPTEFVTRLFDHIKQLPKEDKEHAIQTIRHTARWIPLDFICPATTDRLQKCFERVKKAHFDTNEPTTQTVAILTELRNNPTIGKQDIIDTIAPMIPPQFKIDLKNPSLVIFVTVFKSACGISVLESYYEKKKYNIHSFLQ